MHIQIPEVDATGVRCVRGEEALKFRRRVRSNPVFNTAMVNKQGQSLYQGPGGATPFAGPGAVPTPNPTTGETWLEMIYDILYDCAGIAAATQMQDVSLFTVPVGGSFAVIGGSTYNKTLLHTNIQSQGAILPNPQRFMIKNLNFVISDDVFVVDQRNLLYTCIGTFIIGDVNRPYFQQPLFEIPKGVGFFGGVSNTGNPAGATWDGQWFSNGYPEVHNTIVLSAGIDAITGLPDQGVPLNQGQNFSFNINSNYDTSLDMQTVTGGHAAANPFYTMPAATGGQVGGNGIPRFYLIATGTRGRSVG
jgi:hypothetical protein